MVFGTLCEKEILQRIEKNLLQKRGFQRLDHLQENEFGNFFEYKKDKKDNFEGRFLLFLLNSDLKINKPVFAKITKIIEKTYFNKLTLVSFFKPTKQSLYYITNISSELKKVEHFVVDELLIDREHHIYVPKYTLVRKKGSKKLEIDNIPERFKEMMSIKNIDCLPTIRNETVTKILFEVGDIVMAENAFGRQLKVITK